TGPGLADLEQPSRRLDRQLDLDCDRQRGRRRAWPQREIGPMQLTGAVRASPEPGAGEHRAGGALVTAQLTLADDAVTGVGALQRRCRPCAGNEVPRVGGAHAARIEALRAARAQAAPRGRVESGLAGERALTREQPGALG